MLDLSGYKWFDFYLSSAAVDQMTRLEFKAFEGNENVFCLPWTEILVMREIIDGQSGMFVPHRVRVGSVRELNGNVNKRQKSFTSLNINIEL